MRLLLLLAALVLASQVHPVMAQSSTLPQQGGVVENEFMALFTELPVELLTQGYKLHARDQGGSVFEVGFDSLMTEESTVGVSWAPFYRKLGPGLHNVEIVIMEQGSDPAEIPWGRYDLTVPEITERTEQDYQVVRMPTCSLDEGNIVCKIMDPTQLIWGEVDPYTGRVEPVNTGFYTKDVVRFSPAGSSGEFRVIVVDELQRQHTLGTYFFHFQEQEPQAPTCENIQLDEGLDLSDHPYLAQIQDLCEGNPARVLPASPVITVTVTVTPTLELHLPAGEGITGTVSIGEDGEEVSIFDFDESNHLPDESPVSIVWWEKMFVLIDIYLPFVQK